MNKQQRWIRRGFLALMFFGLNGAAFAIEEVEQFPPFCMCPFGDTPQVLSEMGDQTIATEGATVSGVIGNLTGSAIRDIDAFSFYAPKGQVLTVRIDGAMGGQRSVETILTLFSPTGVLVNESARSAAGEPLIEKQLLDEDGIWTVVVSPFSVFFTDGGGFASGSTFLITSPYANGDYSLEIIPAAPTARPIAIRIKPGSSDRAPVNPKAKGNVPVALLGSDTFNPFDVEVESLTFGASGDERSLSRCAAGGADMNGDGYRDRVCLFENDRASFNADSTMGVLKGRMKDGTQFEGKSALKAIPAQAKGKN